MVGTLVSLLIDLLILGLVCTLGWYILTLLPLPEPFKRIAMLIFVLIVSLVLLGYLLPMSGHSLLWR